MMGGMLMATVGVVAADDAAYRFDDRLLLGSGLAGGSIERFNRADRVEPGSYLVDIHVNDAYVTRSSITFRDTAGATEPCLTEAFIHERLQVAPSAGKDDAGCQDLGTRLPGATFAFDAARLRLDLWVPQALSRGPGRGQVDATQWDPGQTMAFLNYDANLSHTRIEGGTTSDYGAVGVNAGLNVGLWRLRHQSNYTYSAYAGRKRHDWNSIRTYAQRPIPALRSTLALGNNHTEGTLFGSIGYRGVRLSSDERMIPDALRNYAPRVQGMAAGKSRVIVSQNGRKLQETMVAPGPFVIEDIYGAAYGGDLDVQVVGVDGTVTRFAVPFSAVPESIRPGYSRYSATVGEASTYSDNRPIFAELTYQRGVSNALTMNLGTRVAENYLALLAGGVIATPYGAFGSNAIFSRVDDDERDRGSVNGYRVELNYSKTFQATDTTVTLAGYRYSSEGFRDLADALGTPYYDAGDSIGAGRPVSRHNQRNQFNVVANQRLGNQGSLYLSGSAVDYFDSRRRDVQFQFGYSNTWRSLSYSVSLSRLHSCAADSAAGSLDVPDACAGGTTFGLSLSMPIGTSPRAPMLSTVASRSSGDGGGNSLQSVLSGTLGERRTTSYAVSAGHTSGQGETQWSGNLQTQTPVASVSVGAAGSAGYQQFTGNVRGALVAHREGVTFGPYVGDTFALIKAAGAAGSSVRGGQGARVNQQGFALVPSLSPYRSNPIGLDPQGMSSDAELVETERKVVPYAGAALRVEFATLAGRPLVVRTRRADGSLPPLGAPVLDSAGVTIGMVGQAGQIYARATDPQGHLQVSWGEAADERCWLPYALDTATVGQGAVILPPQTCIMGTAPREVTR